MKEFLIVYWLEILFSTLIGLIGMGMKKMWNQLRCEIQDQQSIKIGVQAILRDRLIQSYNYHITIGHCSIHDRDSIVNMYEQYDKLGANGVMDGLIDEILALPVVNKSGKEVE